ncbi:hypothetical protein BDN70DRAFT_899457 [Pholiota conissans]|uniref:Uncharacterized protein n=1 Tax=Pholiota conissans TaxID=109636 RepID=A0A9P6CPD2_9AGAR|nr:hypothetical protein BDN70DRAFT_899457 [Pholiota conissans]
MAYIGIWVKSHVIGTGTPGIVLCCGMTYPYVFVSTPHMSHSSKRVKFYAINGAYIRLSTLTTLKMVLRNPSPSCHHPYSGNFVPAIICVVPKWRRTKSEGCFYRIGCGTKDGDCTTRAGANTVLRGGADNTRSLDFRLRYPLTARGASDSRYEVLVKRRNILTFTDEKFNADLIASAIFVLIRTVVSSTSSCLVELDNAVNCAHGGDRGVSQGVGDGGLTLIGFERERRGSTPTC